MATDSSDRALADRDLPPEVIEDLLSSSRRRALLQCLADAGGELAVADLAACAHANDHETASAVVGGADRQRLREALYEEHLPKLTATGVVRYDSMRERVGLTAPAIVDRIDG